MSKYADILKRKNNISNTRSNDSFERNEIIGEYVSTNVTGTRKYFSNTSRNYDTWEFSYFRELINMRNIFLRGIKKSNEYEDKKKYFLSAQFFEKFCHFIYETSSGSISPYLEPLTELEEEDYWNYLKTKKQE